MLLTRLFPWFVAARKPVPIATDFCDRYPGDLSWIQKMASIGDSYAAGLGSGTRVDFSCSRYSTAYPTILYDFLRWCGSDTTHQSLACSGADTTEILAKQVPALNSTNFDLITISAGGNDIGLTPILSNCVYQFYMAGEDACQKSIDEARERIADDTQLFRNVTRLIEAAKLHLNTTQGMVYLTGYARFFGTEDDNCNNVTWAVWRNIEHTKQYLKLEMRQALNNLVLHVNAVLHRAVQAAGPNVGFIDYDLWVATQRGRYCEAGVHEPDPNRWGLMFYEWDTIDIGENKTDLQNSTGDGVPKGSFEGGIAEQINKTLQEHPDWTFDKDKGFVKKNESEMEAEGIIGDTIHWMIPDSYKRVFHMRRRVHQTIAGYIWNDLKARSTTHTSDIEEL